MTWKRASAEPPPLKQPVLVRSPSCTQPLVGYREIVGPNDVYFNAHERWVFPKCDGTQVVDERWWSNYLWTELVLPDGPRPGSHRFAAPVEGWW